MTSYYLLVLNAFICLVQIIFPLFSFSLSYILHVNPHTFRYLSIIYSADFCNQSFYSSFLLFPLRLFPAVLVTGVALFYAPYPVTRNQSFQCPTCIGCCQLVFTSLCDYSAVYGLLYLVVKKYIKQLAYFSYLVLLCKEGLTGI